MRTRFPPEVRKMVYDNLSSTGPRYIYTSWDHFESVWSYRAFERKNQIPASIYGYGGLMKADAMVLYKPAPQLDLKAFPYFNYRTDTLVFQYRRCGNSEDDVDEYITAMHSAGQFLARHQQQSAAPGLRFLEVAYCPGVSAREILASFAAIK